MVKPLFTSMAFPVTFMLETLSWAPDGPNSVYTRECSSNMAFPDVWGDPGRMDTVRNH